MSNRWDEPPSAMEQYMGDLIFYLRDAVEKSKDLGMRLEGDTKEKNDRLTQLLENCQKIAEMVGEDMTEIINENFFLIDNNN